MATAIDKRVVQMEFDNKQFESGVKTSLSTLEQLKDALNMEGVGKGLDDISKSVGAIDLTNINSNLQILSNRFSTWGIVGMTAIQNITSGVMELGSKMVSSLVHNPVFDQIKSGGISRALNLEDANFKLRNILGSAEAAAEVISGPVNDAVSGTAFGLDEAAKVASQLTTSGIQDLDELGYHLRTISDVAAMAGSSYSEIGYIFTKVAAKGKVQGSELAMLTERGIAAYDALAHYLNISVEDVQEAMKKGLIDFETFSAALANEFGGSAAKANDTFTGALANMRAALSRIGAKVATPALEDLRDVFNALRVSINGVNAQLDPLIGGNGVLIKRMRQVADFVVKKVSLSETQLEKVGKVVQNVADLFDATFDNILTIADPLIKVFKTFVPEGLIDRVIAFTAKLATMAQNFKLTESELAVLKTVFSVFFGVIRLGITVVSNFLGIIGAITDFILDLVVAMLDLVSSEEAAKNIADGFNKAIDTTNRIGKKVIDFFEKAGEKIKSFVDYLKRLRDELKKMPAIQKLKKDAEGVFTTIKNAVTTILSFVLGLFSGGAIDLEKFFSNPEAVAQTLNDIVQNVYDFVGKVKSKFEEIKKYIKEKLPSGFGKVKEVFKDLGDRITGIATAIKNSDFAPLLDFITGLADKLPSMEQILKFFEDAKKKIGGFVNKITNLLAGKFGDPSKTYSNVKEAVTALWTGIRDAIKEIPIDKIFDYTKKGALAFIIFQFIRLMHSLDEGAEGLAKIPKHIADVLKSFTAVNKATALKSVSEAFKNIAQSILIIVAAMLALTYIPEDKFSDIASIMALILIAILLIINSLTKFKKASSPLSYKDIVKDVGTIQAALLTLGNGLLGAFKSFLNVLGKATVVVAVVVSVIGIIAAIALMGRMIATLNTGELVAGIVGVIAILAVLVTVMILINKFGSANIGAGTAATVFGITTFVAAIGVLVMAMAALMQVTGWQNMAIAGTIIAALMFTLMIVVNSIAQTAYAFSDQQKSIKPFVALVLSMLVVVAAVELLLPALVVLSAFGARGLMGATGVFVVILGLLAAVATMGAVSEKANPKNVLAMAGSMVIMAAAISIIAEAIVKLSTGDITQGAIAVGVIAAALVVLAVAFGAIPVFQAAVLPLLSFAAALLGFGIAAAGFGVAAFLIAAAIGLLKDNLVGFIDAIVYFSQQLVANAPVIFMAVMTILGMIVLGIGIMKAQLAVEIAGLILACIAAFSQMTPELFAYIGKMLLDGIEYLTGMIGVIVSALLTFVAKLINELAKAISGNAGPLADSINNLVIALTNLLIDVFVRLFGDLVILFADMLEPLLSAIPGVGKKFEGMGEMARDTMNAAYEALDEKPIFKLKEIEFDTDKAKESARKQGQEDAPEISENYEQGLFDNAGNVDLTKALTAGIPSSDKKAAIEGLVTNGLGIDQLGPTVEGMGIDSLSGMSMDSINSVMQGKFEMPDIMQNAAGDNISSLVDGFTSQDSLAQLEGAGATNVDSYIAPYDTKAPEANAAGASVAEEGAKGADSKQESFIVAGVNAVTGFINGLVSRMTDVSNNSADIATTALTSMQNRLDEHSPSRESFTIGDYFALGFINAIVKRIKDVRKTTAELGSESLNGLHEAVAGIASAVDSDIDVDPTIRPVLDLSGVQSGAAAIDDLMNRERYAMADVNVIRNVDPNTSRLDGILGRLNMNDQNGQSLLEKMSRQYDLLAEMLDAYKNMPMVLDSGALVGGIAAKMDDELGYRAQRAGRW